MEALGGKHNLLFFLKDSLMNSKSKFAYLARSRILKFQQRDASLQKRWMAECTTLAAICKSFSVLFLTNNISIHLRTYCITMYRHGVSNELLFFLTGLLRPNQSNIAVLPLCFYHEVDLENISIVFIHKFHK